MGGSHNLYIYNMGGSPHYILIWYHNIIISTINHQPHKNPSHPSHPIHPIPSIPSNPIPSNPIPSHSSYPIHSIYFFLITIHFFNFKIHHHNHYYLNNHQPSTGCKIRQDDRMMLSPGRMIWLKSSCGTGWWMLTGISNFVFFVCPHRMIGVRDIDFQQPSHGQITA